MTSEEREFIAQTYYELFSVWFEPVNTSNDWNIKELIAP